MGSGADEVEDGGSPRHWLLVAALLAIYIYAFIDRTILALLVEPIRRDLGATDLDMGLLLGLGFAAFFAACSIPAGHFVDRLNRRFIIVGASLLWALMTVVCGTATTMVQLFVGRAGVGLAEAVILPASFSLIRDAVPLRSRGLAFSLYAMGPLIGGAASLLLGGRLLSAAGKGAFADLPLLGSLAPWQCTLVIAGLCGLPLSLLLFCVPEPDRPARNDGKDHGSGLVAGFRLATRHMLDHLSIYAPLVLFVTFSAMSNFSQSGWIPAMFGRNFTLPPQKVGPMLGSVLLPCGIGGLLLSGVVLNWLTRRGGDIRTYGLIATIGTTVGLAGTGIATTIPAALLMYGIGAFFLGTAYSVGASTISQITPVRLMGRVTAIYFLIQSLLGQALGPFLVAFGSERLFNGRRALGYSLSLWCTLFGVAMIFAVLSLRRRLRRAGDVATV